ncbi:hypothetical protein ABEG61_12640 [Pantoea agglomerans]|uniref:hypothetical protein n=1 Tax=Enterobacter agglomerans TaxID=549 RepID=UPI003208B64C
MSDKKYPSNLYLESVTTSVDFASHVSVEAVIVMARELLALRKGREIPEGWKLVPVEPTESMIVDGFESEPGEDFIEPEAWEAFQMMSGCQQAAYKARLCWSAMIDAAPTPPE